MKKEIEFVFGRKCFPSAAVGSSKVAKEQKSNISRKTMQRNVKV